MSDEAPAAPDGEEQDAEEQVEGEPETAKAEAAPKAEKKARRSAEVRRKRKAKRTEHADEDEARTPAREGVPAFAQSFPADPALDALVAAFEQGNYAKVRAEAPALAERADDPKVQAAARVLLQRLDPDPIALYLMGTAALLLAFLAAWFWMHPHQIP
ncbi:MAG: hypothetical protein U0359_33080 [Byssovorax sp.]